jgi:OOP family OmpA-OmpF porin
LCETVQSEKQFRPQGEDEVSRRTAILVALGSLFVLTWLTVATRYAVIETDLAERTAQVLSSYAISGVDIDVDGRDVYLSGVLSPKLAPSYVSEIVGGTWGIRRVSVDELRQQESMLNPASLLTPRFETQRIVGLGGNLDNPLNARACQRMMARVASSSTVGFQVNGASPLLESYPLLNDLAAVAYQCPNTRIVIGGHIDAGDDSESKLHLTQARVEAVERFFRLAGIAPERMQTVAYGDSQPLASNSSPEGRAANRRITFDVLPLD